MTEPESRLLFTWQTAAWLAAFQSCSAVDHLESCLPQLSYNWNRVFATGEPFPTKWSHMWHTVARPVFLSSTPTEFPPNNVAADKGIKVDDGHIFYRVLVRLHCHRPTPKRRNHTTAAAPRPACWYNCPLQRIPQKPHVTPAWDKKV